LMIINCVSYKNGKRVQVVPLDDISEVVKDPDTFVWLGLFEVDTPLLKKIQEEFELHELAIEDAENSQQRPKVEMYGESMFIVLKTAELWEGKVQYGASHLFVGKNFIITIRHSTLSTYSGLREHCELNPKMLAVGPGFVLYSIMDFIVDHYLPVVTYFETQFYQIDAQIFKEQFHALEQLYELKRQLLHLRNNLLPIADICSNLMRFHESLIPKDLRVYFRDIQDHTERIIAQTDTMRDMLNTAMQVHLALVGIGQNNVVKRLAGWGAVLAIPTVIFSLYGMNFNYIPELQWKFGYPIVLVVTVGLCVFLYQKLNRDGWL
jgi:magnesium transporter